MSEWLDLMLDEVAQRRAEAEAAAEEARRRAEEQRAAEAERQDK